MNLVFDKNTLRAVSVFDNNLVDSSEEILRKMFPQNFDDMLLWVIMLLVIDLR